MSRYRDFDAARAEANAEPLTFTLGGEDFTAATDLPSGVLLDMAAAFTSDDPSMGLDLFSELFRVMVAPEDAERFAVAVRKVGLSTVLDLVGWIVEESTGRPFNKPSPSPPRPVQSGGSSNGDSLAWAADHSR